MQLRPLATVNYPWDWRSVDEYTVALRVAPERHLAPLRRLPRLQRLSLPGRSLEQLMMVDWPVNLTALDLSELRSESKESVVGAVVTHRSLPPTVRRLTLDRSELPIDLASSPLEELSVNECPRVVSWPPTLRALSLDWALIGAEQLARLPTTLRRLHVACQPCLTDDHLRPLTGLVELSCPHCPDITNDGLRCLTQLEYLDCTDCPRVSDKGLKPLQRLRVLICGDCPRVSMSVIEYLPALRRLGYGGQGYHRRAVRTHRHLTGLSHRAPVERQCLSSGLTWAGDPWSALRHWFSQVGRALSQVLTDWSGESRWDRPDRRLTVLTGLLFLGYLVALYLTGGQLTEPLLEF